MFQYFWPENVICEKCKNSGDGATFFICNEPIYSICENCDPHACKDARKYANFSASEEFFNAWELLEMTENANS